MKYKWLIAGALVLAEALLCGGIVLSVTNAGVMVGEIGRGFTPNNWRLFDSNRYAAEATEEKRFAVNTPAKLIVENKVGKVNITSGASKEITISMKKRAMGATQADADARLVDMAMRVDLIQDGDTVTVKVTDSPPRLNTQVDFVINVPEETTLKTTNAFGEVTIAKIKGEVEVKTNAGTVRVNDIQGNVNIDSDFGEITLENVAGDKVDVRSNAGAIRLKQVTAKETVNLRTDLGDLRLDQVSAKTYTLRANAGKIAAQGVSGVLTAQSDFGSIEIEGKQMSQLNLRSNSGSVRYSGSLGDGPHSLRTDFGTITLTLPKETALDVSLKTDFGSIKSDLALVGTQARTSWTGKFNNGGAVLTATTNNGSINIEILK